MTDVASTVEVPAAWLAQAAVLPDRCARHGLPVVRRVNLVVKSRPPRRSVWRLAWPGNTVPERITDTARALRFTRVTGWPLCARCAQSRAVGLTIANMLFWGGAAAFVIGFVLGSALTILAGLAGVLLAVLPLHRASLPRLTQAETSADGENVIVTGASREFADQLRLLADRNT